MVAMNMHTYAAGATVADTRSKVPTCKFWPRELCERIAAGVVECLMSMHENSTLQNYFPEAAAEASADAEPATCPACKGHMRKTDLRHQRCQLQVSR